MTGAIETYAGDAVILATPHSKHRAQVEAAAAQALQELDEVDHLPRLHPGKTVVERDPGAGDRGGAGAAVGLDDVAIERDRPLSEPAKLRDAAERPSDQALDLLSPSGGFTFVDLAWGTR